MAVSQAELDKLANPLTEDHLVTINDNLAKIVAGRKALDLAERAGFNVAKQRAAIDDLESQLKSVKQTYFPGR